MDPLKEIQAFLSDNELIGTISFLGDFPENARCNYSKKAEVLLDLLFEELSKHHIGVITDGRKWNLSGLATEIAKKHKMKVIGILPKSIVKDINPDLDLSVGLPQNYDETLFLIKASNILITLGGKPETGVAIFTAIQAALDFIHNRRPHTPIIPVKGFGGVTDMLIGYAYNDEYPSIVSESAITVPEILARIGSIFSI